jgi:CelD/BcsL family acetyltransferase involved in cellulose biosynthesis
VLYIDGQPAAAQFWITTRLEACIYKLAYDERYADMSVGALLSREMFRQALDVDKAARIDYGIGSEPYKREWMSATQEIFGVCAYSRGSIRGMGNILAARLRATAKRLVARP